MHLDYIAELWKNYILSPVDKILFELKQEFPMLTQYTDMSETKEFYSEQNIKEGVYLELQHLLEHFVNSINNIIDNKFTLNRFREAEVKKSEVEAKVYEFKRDLDRIYYS